MKNTVEADLTHDIVAVNLTADSLAFVNMLIDDGTQGDSLTNDLDVNATIRDLVDAIYQVFAGATVTAVRDAGTGLVTAITLTPVADSVKYKRFKDMETHCTNAINKFNRLAGYKHVIEF